TFREPLFAQLLYLLNGNKSDGLHYDITAEDPERLEDEVEEVIDKYGEFIPASDVMTNFGFAALRSGADYSSAVGSTAVNTSRDVWMYFGSIGASHGHKDTMNLGMTAFGLNFMPDLGYPEKTGKQPNRLQWIASTLSHNTVMVDEKEQEENEEIRGKIKHFDGDGTVQVMDVSAPYAYKSADEYRRSVVYVKTDDENSYAVDFFRVLGGDSHLYSFHAASNSIKNHNGLDFTLVEDENGTYISGSQLDENGEYKGTYAGRDVTYIKKTAKDGTVTVRLPVEGEKLASNEVELPLVYGEDPNSPNSWEYETLFPRGYTWLRNIDRDAEPENKVEVDFEIKDFNKAIKDSKDLGLYMTVLNDSNVKNGANAEISIADGLPPQKVENKNIDKLKYVLIKNEGNNLDTTFTTVFEPYKGSRYISSADEIKMNAISGTPAASDTARAVKVTHKSGRVDYIFYATNNAVTYEINDNGNVLSFRGFVGVYTLQNGANTYRYVLDGDIIGEATEKVSSIEGTVKTFTKTHEEKNEIVITTAPGTAITDSDVAALAGKLLVIDNGAETRSGTFKIENVTLTGSDITIDIGRITPIRKYVDSFNPDKGYVYMISEGQNARIPLDFEEDGAPVFDAVSDGLTVSAGSSIKVAVSASSPIENVAIAGYEGETLPRGASINAATGEFTWKPDSSQIGENHVAITARDEYGRENTVHFTITVYGSTTGSSSKDDDEEADSSGSTGETTTPSGGGGGGGGGGAPTPDNSGATEEDNNQTDNGGESGENGGNTDNTGTEDGALRFTDLGNHAWAEDAINTLATDGIIKGTSASTFSPAANITRADFALLLVRAFKLTSDNTENFADVSANDYFASELAIARNTGIVNGIGDNKFAPRNTITRQDMMVIVYRALQNQSLLLGEKGDRRMVVDEVLSQYPDFDTVAPYAREAVTALIGAGLVNGKNNLIAPADYTTRAEVAVLIKRILDYTK
ncbi:MAG: S-layer homology domain-containing protein, partial [Oscillospiraceae bacterium]|nr:S-layer homology domain-containing protein [Oscillospiraceae bacterium]